ncbi:MAG TPA: DUF2845 domain-containing protein [Steroidobacteraceae bacterium]|nr:DUF2845 domain-containing protein [Steroidobacteraceae bacterium]
MKLPWIAIGAIALLASSPAFAFRCGNKLVLEGDTRSEVINKCGEPDEVTRKTMLRAPIYWYYGTPITVGGVDIEIPVEIWLYNLGPSRLMQRLRFEDGELVDIETLGYGYLK